MGMAYHDEDEFADDRYDSVTEVDEYSDTSDFSYQAKAKRNDEEIEVQNLENKTD